MSLKREVDCCTQGTHTTVGAHTAGLYPWIGVGVLAQGAEAGAVSSSPEELHNPTGAHQGLLHQGGGHEQTDQSNVILFPPLQLCSGLRTFQVVLVELL